MADREPAAPQRTLLVGTAGHVDHGKTALLLALTGIDCDRLAEEKARGITIDLGFAHLTQGDVTVGFVDVPGHERFVHNALAGLGGLDLMLLVIDAAEGVKPQTREHVAICDLLAVPDALAVVTKIDLVDADTRELVALEVRELLASTRFATATLLETSSRTGEGIDRLREELIARATIDPRPRAAERPARLPIDRGFVAKGRGTVVTGTLASGAIEVGDELETVPGGRLARVREIQIHGEKRDRGRVGERVALQLAGLELADVERGLALATPGTLGASRRLLAQVRWLEPREEKAGWTDVRLFLGTAESPARVRTLSLDSPLALRGATDNLVDIVEIVAAHPVAAARGDRLVLRRLSPATTLGGGWVLDPVWRRPRLANRRVRVEALAGTAANAASAWLAESGARGLLANDLARRWGSGLAPASEFLRREVSDGRAIALAVGRDTRFIAPATLQRLAQRATALLSRHGGSATSSTGMPRAEFLQRLLPGAAIDLGEAHLRALLGLAVVVAEDDTLRLPGPRPPQEDETSKLAEAIAQAFDRAGLSPPSPGKSVRPSPPRRKSSKA